jgi:hypothetical protein
MNRWSFRVITFLPTEYSNKCKAFTLQAYGAQRVLRRLWLPDSVTLELEGGRLSASRTGRLYPQ